MYTNEKSWTQMKKSQGALSSYNRDIFIEDRMQTYVWGKVLVYEYL